MPEALHALTMHETRALLARREVSAEEVVQASLARIEALDPKVHAYLTLTPEAALLAARAVDEGKASGPLAGVPIAVKDVMCTEGVRTTCGSKILENFVPPYDAHVVERLKASGAVILGKTNMDEFAMGSSTENSAYGVTRNPWDLSRVPGGSSGGSAAAVAADLCAGALGSDTGGSIRQPASFCGCVGLKPTYGRVSRYGLVAFASSSDQIGPLVKDVEDAALMLSVIAGHDPRDSTCVPREVPDYASAMRRSVKGLRLGVPKEYFIEGIEPDVREAVEKAVETLRGLGAEVVEVALPHTEYGLAVYYIIAPAEASSNLARYDGVKYGFRAEGARDLLSMYGATRSGGFGAEVKRRIMLGTYVLSAGYYDAYYKKASQARTLIREDFVAAFERCDAILGPVSPMPAFPIGEKADDPVQMYLADVFTLPGSMAGVPGISVPCGFSKEGLPVGLQVFGPHFREDVVLQVAWNYEQATPWRERKPGM